VEVGGKGEKGKVRKLFCEERFELWVKEIGRQGGAKPLKRRRK